MTIAFCDDDNFLLTYLSNTVKQLISKHNHYNFSFEYYCYNKALDFLRDYNSKLFDIVFLDIEMPQISGLEVGNKIYAINNDVFIFYVTSYESYLSESIKHRVYRFVSKNDIKELERGIISLFDDLLNLRSRYKFNFKNSTYNLPTNSIFYCESVRNKIFIHTDTKIFEQVISIKQLIVDLPRNFCRCHSSFVVNVSKIREIHEKSLILLNDVEIPFSRKYRVDLLNCIGDIF